jgi:hypothetical protein
LWPVTPTLPSNGCFSACIYGVLFFFLMD